MDIDLDFINEELKYKIEDSIKDEVKAQVLEFVSKPENLEKIAHSLEVRKEIHKQVESYCINEIGNRLRCGIYNNLQVKEAFEKNFSELLSEQFKQELRYKALEISKQAFSQYLDNIKTFLKSKDMI